MWCPGVGVVDTLDVRRPCAASARPTSSQRALLNPLKPDTPVSALERSQRRGGAGRLPATAIGRSLSRGGPVLTFARLVDLVCALSCPLAAGAGAVPGRVQLVGNLRP